MEYARDAQWFVYCYQFSFFVPKAVFETELEAIANIDLLFHYWQIFDDFYQILKIILLFRWSLSISINLLKQCHSYQSVYQYY